MKSLKTYIKEAAAPTNVGIYRALYATKKVGYHSNDNAPRVSNPENLSDDKFIQLIKNAKLIFNQNSQKPAVLGKFSVKYYTFEELK